MKIFRRTVVAVIVLSCAWGGIVNAAPDARLSASDEATLSQAMGVERYVLNGLDPALYIFAESKDDYFLFLSSMQGTYSRQKHYEKGLDIALALSKQLGIQLV